MMARNYRKEYDEYHGTPEQRKNRSMRNKARRLLKPGKGMEVDHKKPLSKGGSNLRGNLQVMSKKANRSKSTKYHHDKYAMPVTKVESGFFNEIKKNT